MSLLLIGCSQQQPGFAIVNHTEQTLKNVTIRSEGSGRERTKLYAQSLEPGTSLSGSRMAGKLGGRSVATWTDAGRVGHSQEIKSELPWGFRGYAGFEFTPSGWRFVPVRPAELNAFLRGGAE